MIAATTNPARISARPIEGRSMIVRARAGRA
jgi:hypothetical protein